MFCGFFLVLSVGTAQTLFITAPAVRHAVGSNGQRKFLVNHHRDLATTTAASSSSSSSTYPRHYPTCLFLGDTTTSSDEETEPTTRVQRLKLKTKETWASFKQRSWLPALVAFGIGVRAGTSRTKQSLQQVATSTGAVDTAAAATPRPPYLLRAVLVVAIGREIWRSIPVWIKRQIPIVGRRSKSLATATTDENDFTSIVTIGNKLSTLFNFISNKLNDDDGDSTTDAAKAQTVVAALLAYLRLQQQPEARQEYNVDRDTRYKSAGTVVDNPRDQLEGLDELFELADWAYDEIPNDQPLTEALREIGYSLVRHDKTALPGSVAHYVAISKERKLAVIGVKGTSSFEDMLTDLCGQAVSIDLPAPFVNKGEDGAEITQIRCHEGIYQAAKRLVDDLVVLVEELLLPAGYQLVLTGHSLGAGTAALAAVLLRTRFPVLRDPKRLYVWAFASPPVLDYDTAQACAPFLTTVVNNSDIIPSCSLSNLIVTNEFLKAFNRKLQENKEVEKKDPKTVSIVMTSKEINDVIDAIQDKMDLRDPDHMYCAGRVLHLFDLLSKKIEEGEASEQAASEANEKIR